MRFPLLKFVLMMAIASSSAYAGEAQRIKLIDGSVLNVEVISMKNGVYTFKSPSLGEFHLNAKRIQSISSSGMPASQTKPGKVDLKQLKATIMANPQNMKLINGLKNDTDVQAVLSDPKILSAIKSGNYTSLATNPKFLKLMNNQKIKQIAGSATQ